jgi:hypothetical protein
MEDSIPFEIRGNLEGDGVDLAWYCFGQLVAVIHPSPDNFHRHLLLGDVKRSQFQREGGLGLGDGDAG